MSGIEERPVKQKEIFVEDVLADLHRMMDDQEEWRRVWKFGIFDKFAIGFGLILFLSSVLTAILYNNIPLAIGGMISAILWIVSGCVKRERNG